MKLRDNKGKIEIAYARSTGDITVLMEKYMAICDWIRCVRCRKISNMEVESDAIKI